jgi:CrcB protein
LLLFLAVGLGGALGAALRYAITLSVGKLPFALPLGTLISNLLAGLACGLVIGVSRHSSVLSPALGLFLTTGLMGGLSTFSAFSLETVDLFKNSNYLIGFANILANVVLGLLSVALGLHAAKLLVE